MSQPILSTGVWVSLPNEVRYRISAIFNIPKSRATEVDDGRLISDGTSHEDLKTLTVEKMNEYLGDSSGTDFYRVFDKVVAKVNDELYPSPTVSQEQEITPAKKRGRPSKKNDKEE